MPKSSIASCTPISLSRCSVLRFVLGVVDQDALGHLEARAAPAGMPVSLEDRADVVDEVGLLELARRDVDRHRERSRSGAAASPAPRPARQASLEHPRAERPDQAGLLGERDELGRRDEPARRGAASAPAPRRR